MSSVVTGPTISAWVCGIGRTPDQVDAALASVRAQAAAVAEIVVVDGHTALDVLLAATDSDFIAWLDAADVLLPGAIDSVLAALPRVPGDLYYGDSVTSAESGAISVRRPRFSPLRLRNHDYLGGLRILRTAAVREAGGFDGDAAVAGPYELALRLTADGAAVHLPFTLSAGPLPGADASTTVTQRHLARIGSAGVVLPSAHGVCRVTYPVVGEPLVSVIIPTRGTIATIGGAESVLVVDAVRDILERSTYPRIEVVIVADDATPQAAIDALIALGDSVRLVRWSAAFNFSAKINRGAAYARGDYLLMLNDDVRLITPDWIETMLGLVQQPGVGLVGTMLLFEDGTVQHGGHLYRDSSAGHIAFRWAAGRDDPLHTLFVDREVSGVTAACAMIGAALFTAVGGFSDLLPGNYNDVDFCLKVRTTGASIVWTPHARLYHFESKTRVALVAPAELETLRGRWERRLLVDGYSPE